MRQRPLSALPVLALTLVGLLIAGCGGDSTDPAGPSTPPPPPPPPPPSAPQVASVEVAPDSLALRVGATGTLQAVVRDAGGQTLQGRRVTWSSNAVSIAAVDSTGTVTAVGAGDATITASSEGRSDSVRVAVSPALDGAEIGPEGGTVTFDNGAVRIDVPAGAVSAATFFGVERSNRALDDPDGEWRVGGATYTLHPEGASFATPVKVTLSVDPQKLPPWVDAETLGLHRWDGSAWHPLEGITVEASGSGGPVQLSGTTTGFSDVTPTVPLPSLTISPGQHHVNEIQRWVFFTVEMDDVALEHWYNFTYEWTTTGQSGEILRVEGNGAEYLTTKAILVDGEVLDDVTVTVRAQRSVSDEEDPPLEVVGTASIAVKADLKLSIEFLPTFGATVFGETEELLLVVRDQDGKPVQDDLDLYFTWSESGFHGELDLATGERVRTNPGIYRARSLENQEFPAPRVDQITVLVEQRYPVYGGTALNPHQVEYRFRELGSSDAFVRVRVPQPIAGRFTSVTQTTSGGACVIAYISVPQIPGATGYELLATDFGDQADPFSGTFTHAWSGPDDRVTEHGNEWRVRLEGGCATNDFAISFRRDLYRNRYGNARLEVTVTEPD